MNAETTLVPVMEPKKMVMRGRIMAGVGLIALVLVGRLADVGALPRKFKTLQAKAAMKGLEIAIKGYKTEYLHLPFFAAVQPLDDNQACDTTAPDGMALIDVLLAKQMDSNPRQIRFWEAPPSKGGAGYAPEQGLRDPWGKLGYKVVLDYNGDGKIANPAAGQKGEADTVTADVILYSAGPDGDFSTWNDNVRSWQ